MDHPAWPPLVLADWEPTYQTLHRWTQMVGKLAVTRAPYLNHWWHVTLHVTARGLSVSMPCERARHLTLTFDLCAHRFVAETSEKESAAFPLEPMTVATFHDRLRATLAKLGVEARIWPVPVEVSDKTPFTEDKHHAAYDRRQVEIVHRILLEVQRVFEIHRGRFLGKASPVHLFWGAFDLAVTRFSGRPNPTPPEGPVEREAYSHEVISHGFWPGGDWLDKGRVEEAIFYAYAVPEPEGFRSANVEPPQARYVEELGEYVLPYEAVRTSSDPERTLLAFMESTYLAAAERAGWDTEALRASVTTGDTVLRARSAAEVFDDHLTLAQQHRFDEDIARNYAQDCVVLMGQGIYRGHDGVRQLAEQLERELPGAHYEYVTKRVEGPVAFLEWTANVPGAKVEDGADSFVIRDGRVVAQTVHYTLR